ncbi:Pfam KH 3 [Fragilaria crotonensis]|nr:Pfam KH 3 [Fragilaria crotonensis]
MDASREVPIGTQNRPPSASTEYTTSTSVQSHRVQQNPYQLNQHSEQQNEFSAPQLCATASTPSSTETGSSVPSDQSTSWQHHASPLAPNQTQTVGSPSGLSAPDLVHDQGVADSQNSAAGFTAAIKLIVSNNVAGSIIGRSGQTISDLQTQSGTRIKLSQADDYYPGTQDRVCLVQGHPDNVKRALNLLLTRLFALQQQQHSHHFAWQRQQQERGLGHEGMYNISDSILSTTAIPGFSFVVRILVPVPCCGMIIGKGGANIKQMVDASGVTAVRLSPKEGGDPDSPYTAAPPSRATSALVIATAERMVSVTGPDLKSCLKCLHIILDGMTSHPDISRYANMTTSYSRVMSSTQNTFPGPQAGIAGTQRLDQGMDPFLGGHDDFFPLHRSPSYSYLDRQSLTPSPHVGIPPSPTPSNIDSMGRYVAFGGHAMPFLPQESPSRPPLQQMQNSIYMLPTNNRASFQLSPSANESLRIPPSHSAPDLLAIHMQNSLRVSDHPEARTRTVSYSEAPPSFVHQLPQQSHSPPGFVAQVAIPENLIGSILGRGGRTLTELQALSDTRIRITQRGEYLPGTKSRVVTIRGATSQAVSNAQYLMNQHLVLPPSASSYPAASVAAPTAERAEYGATPYPHVEFPGPNVDQHPPS